MASAERGFTLIEVLVALVATAILLTILLDGVDTALTRWRANLDEADAVRLASSVLEQSRSSELPLQPAEGDEAGLHWVLLERPLITDPRGIYQLVEVQVDIINRDNRRIQSFTTRNFRKMVPQ
jgi:prepilin-type N-terminal cleavage/methylation domain-containing protein